MVCMLVYRARGPEFDYWFRLNFFPKISLHCSNVDPGYLACFKRILMEDLMARINDLCNLKTCQEATALNPIFIYLKYIEKKDQEFSK